MFIVLGHLSGALGLFFMGAKLLTEQLKVLTNRRLRLRVARWTGNRWMGFAWGVIAGSVMESMTVLTLALVSMLRSDLVSSKRAFPILLGGNVGGALLVLIVMLDVKLMALYVLGLAYFLTLILASGRASRYRAMATACFGLAMIVFGSVMLKESVAPLASYAWFQQTMEWVGGSLLLPLLSGAMLTFVMQSSMPVVVAGIGMAAAGLLTVHQVLILYCGACLGSSLILYVLTLTVTGRARQVAMYQVLYNLVLNAIFVPLICIEAYFNVPLAAAALRASGLSLETSLATYVILCEALTAVFQMTTLHFSVRRIERWWPSTTVEALAKPQFIHDDALDDVETALRLVDLEQRRLLKMLSRHLDAARRGAESSQLREATSELMGRIEEFLHDLAARCPDHEVDVHNAMMTRQKLFGWLEEQVIELCDALHGLPPESPGANWAAALLEGIDVVLLVLLDTLASDEATAWPSTTQLMGDRSELLRRLRDASLKDDATLGSGERARLLNLANVSEHVFLLVSQLAHEYRMASGIDEAFLDDAGLEDPAWAPMARPTWPLTASGL